MVDNIYLESVLKPWSTLRQVTSIDKLHTIKKIMNLPASFIINTSPAPAYGHWILTIFTTSRHCIFFDSFALTPDNYNVEIKKFIAKNSISVEFNLLPIQAIQSEYCGFFCIAKIISSMLNENNQTFMKHFSSNLRDNDAIVIKLIQSLVNI